MPLFLGAQNNIDSTKQGYFRAQISLFCKNTFDFRNTFSRKKYNNAIKNSDNLVLPESCKNYRQQPYLTDKAPIWVSAATEL
jgi:hypothetical protein